MSQRKQNNEDRYRCLSHDGMCDNISGLRSDISRIDAQIEDIRSDIFDCRKDRESMKKEIQKFIIFMETVSSSMGLSKWAFTAIIMVFSGLGSVVGATVAVITNLK